MEGAADGAQVVGVPQGGESGAIQGDFREAIEIVTIVEGMDPETEAVEDLERLGKLKFNFFVLREFQEVSLLQERSFRKFVVHTQLTEARCCKTN